ncbi:SIMPL domain-containing protein [Pseudoxanthomonas sp. PXM03]|jgi:uncharacterized protein YggE|uniref:SIMPL domain-containing protein n=1 Tax=Pseudoxanthomonas sp. PXM03 TaxID=2769284 RepID=UPI001783617C|nr:SIMPL domain-containing protein [Pseudoxanthomonas sp. PXM03]MBD9435025.1 SIMPL domain-containing protein [Pseudoxanthomonas sp. PXM03]
MKAIHRVLLAVVALASGHVQAQVNALPPTRHILVYGDAQARAIPDRFKIAIQFEATDINPDTARRAVEHHVTSTLAKLKDAHVPSDEIVATSLQIGPRHRYDQKLQEQVFVGTQVSRSLTARFSRQADLERFLATVETSQSLRISDVTTELSSEAELRRALRDKTIASAKTKADDMARAYGARLGPVYSVSDVAPQFEYGIREGEWPVRYEWRSGGLDRIEVTGSRLERAGVDTSLQSGYVTYTDKIYTVFLLAD